MSVAGDEKGEAPRDTRGLATHLELIARMTQDFASSLDMNATLHNALARITHHIGAEGGAIFLVDDSRSGTAPSTSAPTASPRRGRPTATCSVRRASNG